jgi:hypothetical protein
LKRTTLITTLLSCLLLSVGAGSEAATNPEATGRPVLSVEALGGTTSIWVETIGPDGLPRRQSVGETDATVVPRATGGDPAGRARFATWDEDGKRWFAYSRDAGTTWNIGRPLRQSLRLKDAAVDAGEPMPTIPAEFSLPADGRLYLVQFKTTGIPEWRRALDELGATVLNHVPHNAQIVRIDADLLSTVRSLDFVERVEPYHPWYRIERELRDTASAAGGAYERIRLMTFEWGPQAKERVIETTKSLGVQTAGYWPSGHVVEFWASPDQIRALAAHDDVMWIDRWTEPQQDMDLVRQDVGADWTENIFGYCGQGVRGEVMDGGIEDTHPDFDGIIFHGNYGTDSHGTATYGIVFGNGDRDGDGDAKGTGLMPCSSAQGIFADYSEFTDRFTHTQELKDSPYFASFQSNSWGNSPTTLYNSYTQEMDDIIWRLDVAITQSQSNNGNRSSRPQAWAKNIISVGAVRHYETLDTSDDSWNFSGSIGPAADGRIKPDVSHWFDSIYTTAPDAGYTPSFGGTSSATPVTAGVVGLIVQMWSDNVWETDPQGATVFDRQPHASTIRALLINNAQQYDFTGDTHDLTRMHQGWGRPSAQVAHERARNSLVVDEEHLLQLDGVMTHQVAVEAGETELKVTMVYPDPPGTTASDLHRINDVNLQVTSPTGTIYHGNVGLDIGTESTPGGGPNGVDTVENVFVRNPQAGIWDVRIEAVEINQDAHLTTPEDDVAYALVVTGATGVYTSGEGTVRFLNSYGACNATYPIRVRDGNVGAGSVTVEVWSDSEPAAETVVLSETATGSGNFTGEIPTSDVPTGVGDGVLTAGDGDTITVRYVDANDGAGGTNVPREATATTDCSGPTISQVSSSAITDTAANVTWTTDEDANSLVVWDSVTPPTQIETRAGSTTSHTVRLLELTECTDYWFAVSSDDAVGNSTVNDNGGAYFRFTTMNNTDGQVHGCGEGRLVLGADTVSCSSDLPVTVSDHDLNQDPGVVETAQVTFTSTTETTPETVTLIETGPDTGDFFGTIPTGPGEPVAGDGILQASHDDLITGRYDDADDGTGNPAVSTDTALAACLDVEIGTVSVLGITNSQASINWSTPSPTTGHVEWGLTPALGSMVASPTLKTNHGVAIGQFSDCDRVYFRVVATDAYGNSGVADAGGVPFEFNANTIPGVIFRDDFDTDTGWTLEGEWEVDAPQGIGTSPGDPTVPYSGTRVLGHDLTGLGANLGNYEPQTTESAISPVIDASALVNGQLLFERWLNVANGSIAYLEARDAGGTWQTVYSTPSIGGFLESSWNSETFDVSAYADGNANFQIRFRQRSLIAGSSDAGWNVDQFILRDGSLPDLAACGGCIGAPTFAGVVSAIDDDPCADSTVTLGWAAAPAWGSGAAGTYSVYRDTQPDFTPGPGNLVASGVGTTSWTDPSPPSGVMLYYVVRAENDETCGNGPNNSGLTDSNLVYGIARNDTSQSAPGDVGDTLRVEGVGGAHARVSWATTGGAATYRLYRSSTPSGGFVLETETADLSYDDADVIGDGQDWYYLVNAVDACGNEGP